MFLCTNFETIAWNNSYTYDKTRRIQILSINKFKLLALFRDQIFVALWFRSVVYNMYRVETSVYAYYKSTYSRIRLQKPNKFHHLFDLTLMYWILSVGICIHFIEVSHGAFRIKLIFKNEYHKITFSTNQILRRLYLYGVETLLCYKH